MLKVNSGGHVVERGDLPPITPDDPRFWHHLLLTAAGYALDRRFEPNSGLRVYRVEGHSVSEASVDLFKDGSWGRYTPGPNFDKGWDLGSLQASLRAVPLKSARMSETS